MRVAIINPPYPLEEFPSPPLGVCYVAAAFEKAGADVRIFDFVVSEYSPQKLRRWLENFSPDVVGTTSVTMSFNDAAEILSAAKEIKPSIVSIMGGPHVSFSAQQTMEQYPGIDMIVIGEGEETIAEIAPRIFDKKAWFEVPGIAFRDENEFFFTQKRQFIQDLDSIPFPARHLLPISKYRALTFPVSIITSRGCPNRCIFCVGHRMVGHKVRYRSIDRVLDEVEHLIALGFNRINIADDLFTSNKKRVSAFCEGIKSRGLDISWTAFSRVNTIDEETVRQMKSAGCDTISFGIETGNKEMLKRIRKGITLEQARRAAAICKKVGVLAHSSFIVGLPGETAETLAETDRFTKEFGMVFGYHFLAPFPGTTVYENIEEYDLELLTTDWRLYDANRPVVRTSSVSADDANDFVDRYMDIINMEWDRIEKGYVEGTNTSEENLKVEGRQSMSIIYDIISKGLIEEYGRIEEKIDGNTETALTILIKRVADATKTTHEITNRVIRNFHKWGNIQIRDEEEMSVWEWTPNPEYANYAKWLRLSAEGAEVTMKNHPERKYAS